MNNKKICQCCKGNGRYETKLMNLGNKTMETHIVPCDFPGCHNGIVDIDKNHRITNPKFERVFTEVKI